MNKLTVGSCFSGIGGLELGLEWTGGFETKWQIEWDDYASKVLEKHWPKVKRYRDIRDVVRPEPVDVICGGFPCQDVSLAGSRAGLEGKRSTLWSEMHRLVCEVKPRWVVAENVPGLLSSDDGRFFGNILRDLASAGYDAEWGVLSAAGVGAPHLRRRVFILGHTNLHGWDGSQNGQGDRKGENGNKKGENQFRQSSGSSCEGEGNVADTERMERKKGTWGERIQPEEQEAIGQEFRNTSEILSDATKSGLEGKKSEGINRGEQGLPTECGGWWSTEPDVGRVAHGVPNRVDRLKCLGNAVVPQVAQKIGEMILKMEGKNE